MMKTKKEIQQSVFEEQNYKRDVYTREVNEWLDTIRLHSIKLGKVLEYLIAQKMKQSYLFEDYKEKDTPIEIKLYFNTQENKEGLYHLSEKNNVIEYLYDRDLLLPYLMISVDKDFHLQHGNEYDIQQEIINKINELTKLYKDLTNKADNRIATPHEILINHVKERIETFLEESYDGEYDLGLYDWGADNSYILIEFK